jgi:anti-sigma regulatory factor (Ser/Thr protein kinase)
MYPLRVEIRFPATRNGLAQGFAALRRSLDTERLDAAPRYHAELVFEEIVANIVRYGAVPGRELQVRVTLEGLAAMIVLTFEDNGVAFDPSQRTEVPVAPKSLEEAQLGGLGLMLVRRAASTLGYQRTADGRNRLTVTVRRPRAPDRS